MSGTRNPWLRHSSQEQNGFGQPYGVIGGPAQPTEAEVTQA